MGFWKKGIAETLLYTAFAAIECGKWDLAIASLGACKEKIMGLSEPIGESAQAEFLPYIEEGVVCIKHRCTWSIL